MNKFEIVLRHVLYRFNRHFARKNVLFPLYFVLSANAVDFNASNKLIYNGYAMISKKYANLYRRYLLI